MDQLKLDSIKSEADRIRREIQPEGTCTIFCGEPIDLENPDMVLGAAYCLGAKKERDRIIKEFGNLLGITDNLVK